MNTQKIQRLCLPLCLMLFLLLCFCTAASAEGTARQPQNALSPTTGLPTDRPYRPFLVTISNAAEARPSWNLSEADIVYEMIIWGPGHTRYAAIYNDSHPGKVGALRSGRGYHLSLREEWDCPIIHYNRDGDTLPPFEERKAPKVFLLSGITTGAHSPAFSRTAERLSPHNAVVDIAWLAVSCWPSSEADQSVPYSPKLPLFQFSETPTAGSQAASGVEIHYESVTKKEPNYLAGYTYNPETNAYDRSYCGYAQIDAESGNRIIAHNIIVQFCTLAFENGELSQPIIDLVGEGRIDAYIDGKRIEGIWQRESVDDKTQFYNADGDVLLLRPGKTFIQVIPTTYGFAYDAATTLCRYAPDL